VLLTAAAPAEATPAPGAGSPVDEAAQIQQALQRTGGNVLQAARLLGLSRSTLRYRMVRYGMGPDGRARGGASQADHFGPAMPSK
jgi:DNA-binding NtrC family response regulator